MIEQVTPQASHLRHDGAPASGGPLVSRL
jgi:hypothetical protein